MEEEKQAYKAKSQIDAIPVEIKQLDIYNTYNTCYSRTKEVVKDKAMKISELKRLLKENG